MGVTVPVLTHTVALFDFVKRIRMGCLGPVSGADKMNFCLHIECLYECVGTFNCLIAHVF